MAVFLLVAASTGAVLSFRWEVDALLNPELFKVKPTNKRLPLSELIQHVEVRFPDLLVSSLSLPKAPEDSLRISLKARGDAHVVRKAALGMKMNVPFNQAFVNPYTGEVLGQRNTSDFSLSRVNFMPFMLRLHYSLFLDKWGAWFMGSCALLWLLTSILGLVLSWPKQWTELRSWLPVVLIRARQGGYKFNYDLHRAASVVTFPILIVIAFTSVYLNLPDVVKPIIEQFSPIGSNLAVPSAGKIDPGANVVPPEQAVETALMTLPGAQISFVSRDFVKGLYVVRLRLPHDVSPNGNNTLFIRMQDGKIAYRRLASERSGADTFVAWQVPLHGGTAFGFIGQILVCLSALALLAICITGLNVWLRKQRGERNREVRRRARNQTSSVPQLGVTMVANAKKQAPS